MPLEDEIKFFCYFALLGNYRTWPETLQRNGLCQLCEIARNKLVLAAFGDCVETQKQASYFFDTMFTSLVRLLG